MHLSSKITLRSHSVFLFACIMAFLNDKLYLINKIYLLVFALFIN